MIEGKKPGEVKVRLYGYLYVNEAHLEELSQALTLNVFRPMAQEGKLHNVLVSTQIVEDDTPIFTDEETNHGGRDGETRNRRLAELREMDFRDWMARKEAT